MTAKLWTTEMDADLLAYVEDHTQAEAAEHFGKTYRAIRSRVYLLQLRLAVKNGIRPLHKVERNKSHLPKSVLRKKDEEQSVGTIEVVNGDPAHRRYGMKHSGRGGCRAASNYGGLSSLEML